MGNKLKAEREENYVDIDIVPHDSPHMREMGAKMLVINGENEGFVMPIARGWRIWSDKGKFDMNPIYPTLLDALMAAGEQWIEWEEKGEPVTITKAEVFLPEDWKEQ